MSEIFYECHEPDVVGSFNASKASRYAESFSDSLTLIESGVVYFGPDETVKLLKEFEVDFSGVNEREAAVWLLKAISWVQDAKRELVEGRNRLWHIDGTRVYEKWYPSECIVLGASSHMTDVLVGRVVLPSQISPADFNSLVPFVQTDDGQACVEHAINSGDAHVYSPPKDMDPDGLIRRLYKNIHRMNPSTPEIPYRYLIKSS